MRARWNSSSTGGASAKVSLAGVMCSHNRTHRASSSTGGAGLGATADRDGDVDDLRGRERAPDAAGGVGQQDDRDIARRQALGPAVGAPLFEERCMMRSRSLRQRG